MSLLFTTSPFALFRDGQWKLKFTALPASCHYFEHRPLFKALFPKERSALLGRLNYSVYILAHLRSMN